MAVAYPIPVFHFKVEWGGNDVGFSEVSGLTQEVQVIEYRDGDSPVYSTTKMSGLRKASNITMKRGISKGHNEFFTWLNNVKMNTPERRDLTITLMNENGDNVMVWKVLHAWPVKVDGPGLKANGNDVAVETIELAHEGVTLQSE